MKIKKVLKTGAIAAAVAAACGAVYYIAKTSKKKKKQKEYEKKYYEKKQYEGQKAHIVGAGIGGMAAAAYLVRDCNFPGDKITIYESSYITGGSNDGIGTSDKGFICRGGRMLNRETYENFWELFRDIPSLDDEDKSVTDEILSFDRAHPTHAKARLIDRDGNIIDSTSMGFTQSDRKAIFKLLVTNERELDNITIEEWFRDTRHFFKTNFWYMWKTTFAFKESSSIFEFKRYLNRMILEFSRIDTLEGVTRTPYNQYDSIILPLQKYLMGKGVKFVTNCTVSDIDFGQGEGITAHAIHLKTGDMKKLIILDSNDLCILTNGCMTDCSTLGDYNRPAPEPRREPSSAAVWKKIALKKPGLGNPEPFFSSPEESSWESFTVTCRGDMFLKMIEEYTGNEPGSGALHTFKDSSWLLSIVVAEQPHFKNQPTNETVLWGYGLYPDREGDYVKKKMKDCTGEEIITELIYQMHFEEKVEDIRNTIVNVIPCYMPYIGSQFRPRRYEDRPKVVPDGSTNFAMISQYVEVPDDIVFTEEYSVRAARMAVYELLGVNREVEKVTPYNRDFKILLESLKAMYR